MNRERFHNELALRLGYERIVNDKRILISVEESDAPLVTLKVEDDEDFCFRVTDNPEEMDVEATSDVKEIIDAAHQAYVQSKNYKF